MNAFQFGRLVGEKMAAGPVTAEAPMSNPAQAASTNSFVNQPGRQFMNSMAREGRNMQRGANLAAAAAPMVGSLAGRAVGGNLGGTIGNLGGALLGQQLRHVGGEVATTFGARSAPQPIPYGLAAGRLSNRPSQEAADMNASISQTARDLDAIASPRGGLLGNPSPQPQAQPQAQSRAPQAMPPRGTGMSQLRKR